MAPCHWGVFWDLFQYAKGYVPVEVGLYLLLPVGQYRGRDVGGIGLDVWVHVELEGWSLHLGQRLMGACVEGGARIVPQDYLLEFL